MVHVELPRCAGDSGPSFGAVTTAELVARSDPISEPPHGLRARSSTALITGFW